MSTTVLLGIDFGGTKIAAAVADLQRAAPIQPTAEQVSLPSVETPKGN